MSGADQSAIIKARQIVNLAEHEVQLICRQKLRAIADHSEIKLSISAEGKHKLDIQIPRSISEMITYLDKCVDREIERASAEIKELFK